MNQDVTRQGAELRATLARLRDLLVRSGDTVWPDLVTQALKLPDDRALARTTLGWVTDPQGLGGLVLSPAAGHAVASCAIDATNRAFNALRSEAFALARMIGAQRS